MTFDLAGRPDPIHLVHRDILDAQAPSQAETIPLQDVSGLPQRIETINEHRDQEDGNQGRDQVNQKGQTDLSLVRLPNPKRSKSAEYQDRYDVK